MRRAAGSPPLPPGPRTPAAGQTAEWIVRPTALLRRSAARHGDAFTLRTLWADTPIVLVSRPEDVKRVFTAPPETMANSGAGSVLEPFAGPSSILLLDGDAHLRQRRLMLPAFHGDRMRSYRPVVGELAARELNSWRRGSTIPTHERMQALTLEIILRVVLGRDDPRVKQAVGAALALTRNVPRLLAMTVLRRDARFRQAVADVDALLFDLVQRPADDGTVLRELQNARTEDGDEPTPRELRDQLVTLLAAGHETTATALAWAFERLARTRQASQRLENDDDYRDAVVKETLRIRPVLSIASRRLTQPFALTTGHTLPVGVQVAPCIYLAHRRKDAWGPDAAHFRPERWLDDDTTPAPYTYIPWGGGTRRCLGAAFAHMEMETVLAEAARAGTFRPVGAAERMRRRSVTLAPARGARITLS